MISEKNGVFTLSTANTTYIFQAQQNEQLEHLYYGSHLNDNSINAKLLSTKYMQNAGTSTLYEENSELNLGLIKQNPKHFPLFLNHTDQGMNVIH
jgi:alpha-galactosidase